MDATAKIVIRHYGGSKAEQVRNFPVEQEISIGRDASCVIRYEADEDLVSRKHARIARDEKDPDQFLLSDLDSRNGTFINKRRISSPEVIRPGDIVQLGADGPELEFNLDPRPLGMTREYVADTEGVASTRDIAYPLPGEPALTSSQGAAGSRTMEILDMARAETRRNMRYIVVAAAAIVILFGGLFVFQQYKIGAEREAREEQVKRDTQALEKLQKKLAEAERTRESQGELEKMMSPEEITKKYGSATVLIEASWKLVYTKTGEQLYHRYRTEKGKKPARKPTYIKLPDGTIEPWLMPDSEDGSNTPVGGLVKGTGFVVSDDGFILTSRHMAAAWYSASEAEMPSGEKPGYVYELTDLLTCAEKKQQLLKCNPTEIKDSTQGGLNTWVPSKTQTMGGQEIGSKNIVGRNDVLDVTFPGSKLQIPARLVRASNEHDVALIRIDVPTTVSTVELGDRGSTSIKVGSPVTALGYPGVSPDVYVRTESQDFFHQRPDVAVVPNFTMTTGHIGRIIKGTGGIKPEGGDRDDYFGPSDILQLSLSAAAGNSGGPVFDSAGKVIGIFYSHPTEGGSGVTFAVPIKYGLDLLKVRTLF